MMKFLTFSLILAVTACGFAPSSHQLSEVKSQSAQTYMKCWNSSPAQVLMFADLKIYDADAPLLGDDSHGNFQITFKGEDGQSAMANISEAPINRGMWLSDRLTAYEPTADFQRLFFIADSYFSDRESVETFEGQIIQPGIAPEHSTVDCVTW